MTEIQLSQEFSNEFMKLQKRAEKGQGEAEYLLMSKANEYTRNSDGKV